MSGSRTQAVLLGGAFTGVLSALPIVSAANCCCLWLIGGGAVTAYLLQQGQTEPLELGEGALGGLLAGVVGAGVYALVAVPIHLVMSPLQRGAMEMMRAPADVPPEVLEMIERLSASTALSVLVGFVVMLVAGAIFSTLGGLVGTLVFRTRVAPPPPPDPIVPAPPGL